MADFTAAEKLNLKREHEKMGIASICKKYGLKPEDVSKVLGDGDNTWAAFND